MSSEDVRLRRTYSSRSSRLEDVFKTSSEDEDERRLQDIFKTSSLRQMFPGVVDRKSIYGLVPKKVLKTS